MRYPCLIALSLLVSCGDDGSPAPGTEGAPCTTTRDCNGGLSCVDGVCARVADAGAPMDVGPPERRDVGPPPPTCPPADRCGSDCCVADEECVDGACLPACASGLRCGPTSACCAASELCIADTCVEPGAACADPIDCGEEEICDETLERCLPRGDGVCEYFPPPGVFAPEQEWAWTGSEVAPESVHVMMAPAVGDLDGDGIPEVVFSTYNAVSSYGGVGVLRAVHGDTGGAFLDVTDPVVCPEAGVALGDLDGDGIPEIVTAGPCNPGVLVALRNDGSVMWRSHTEAGADATVPIEFGAIALADFEGDGRTEVVVGGAVFESDGLLRWSRRPVAGANCCSGSERAPVTAVYDVDGDGALEVVGGNIAWNGDGSVQWEQPGKADGYVAIADFFDDDVPDVVVVHQGNVSIRRGTDGEDVWGPQPLPGGGRGGPPTVADFDGDGRPEIGVANASVYAVFDPDGDAPVLWSQPTQDTSSNITGSSVFDFDGDGRAEVVYNDECFMRVYAGADGTVVAQVPQNSHTLIEYPLIVDVDGDGNAEIVFAANDAVRRCDHVGGYTGYTHGIRVFRDAADNWVGTRRVWNQHTYSVTHVREDLSIPSPVQPNWRRFNNFRQNPQSFDAPDLEPSDLVADVATCPPAATLRAVVHNRGAASVGPGLAVSFYVGLPAGPSRLVATVRTTAPIVPGGSTAVSARFEPTEEEIGATEAWFVRVDDAGDGRGEHNECDEDDNVATSEYRCGIVM